MATRRKSSDRGRKSRNKGNKRRGGRSRTRRRRSNDTNDNATARYTARDRGLSRERAFEMTRMEEPVVH